MEYDEIKYWNNRVNPNTEHGGDITSMIEYVRARIPQYSLVLDYGAGVGRLLKAYEHAGAVVGIDVSKIYATRLFAEAEKYDFDFSLVLRNDIYPPTHIDGFDVAVASMVLLHQKPKTVGRIMRDLACMANKVIVLTWMSDRKIIPELAPHCFNHDYKKICYEYDLNIVEWDLNHENLRFVYEISEH